MLRQLKQDQRRARQAQVVRDQRQPPAVVVAVRRVREAKLIARLIGGRDAVLVDQAKQLQDAKNRLFAILLVGLLDR